MRRNFIWMAIALSVLAVVLTVFARTTGSSPDDVVRTAGAVPIAVLDDTAGSCAACAITLEPVRRIVSDDSVALTTLPRLVAWSDARLLAYTPEAQSHPIVVFDSTSRATVLGGFGQGPGEYRVVSGVAIGRGDTVFVAHDNNRISIFDSIGAFVSMVTSPVRLSGGLVPHGNGALTVVGGSSARHLASIPLHSLDRSGRLRHAFGTEGILVRSGIPQRAVSPADRAGVWAAEYANYRLEQTDSTGNVKQILLVKPPRNWMTGSFATAAAWDSAKASMPRVNVDAAMATRPKRSPVPPKPQISGILQDGNYLWVTIQVAAANWQNVEIAYRTSPEGTVLPTEESVSHLYRTVIDLIDLPTRQLLARNELPGMAQLLTADLLARTSFSAAGFVEIELYRVAFHTRHPSGGPSQ